MIAAVTREARFVVITAVIVAAAIIGFYFLARQNLKRWAAALGR